MARKRKKSTAAAPPTPMDAPESTIEAAPASVPTDEVQPDEVQPDEVAPNQRSDEQSDEQSVEVVAEQTPAHPAPVAAAEPEPEPSEPRAAEEPDPVTERNDEPAPVADQPVPSEPGPPAEPEPVAAMDDEPAPIVTVAGAPMPSEPKPSEEPEPAEPPVQEEESPTTEPTAAAEADDTGSRHIAPEAEPPPEPTPEPTSEPTLEPTAVDGAGSAAYGEGPDTEATDAAQVDDSDPERGPVEGKAAWRRLLLMGRPRSTKANLLGALLAIALGIGIGTQVQLTNQRGLSELSQSDLVRVLDDISLRSSRLDDQIRELEATRDRLKNGTGSTAEALAQAQKRVDTLGILAGTVGAQGPGISLAISDPDKKVSGPLVLDLIQELRDAGAEAIDVGGVRVVASSFVGDSGGTILIDGTEISRPLMIKAIGDPKTLSSAMTIPGGIVETVRQKGARATVTELGSTEITSIHSGPEPTNATPSQ